MKNYKITFTREQLSVEVLEGTTLLDAQIAAGIQPDAPCGGQGTCSKCQVRILSGQITGIQKACKINIQSDMEVDTILRSFGHSLLTKGISRQVPVVPMIQSISVAVDKCKPGDSRSDWDRLKNAVASASFIEAEDIPFAIDIVRHLYETLQENVYQVTVRLCGSEIIQIIKKNTPYYLTAFDIGTTSIVGYLLDGQTGEELAVSSILNPQAQYGADVIMRSNYALEHNQGDLSRVIRQGMNQVISELCTKASIVKEDILQISFVGNTCMHHLFLGISPNALVHSPYNPTVSEPLMLLAADYDLSIHPNGRLMVLPNIAGFVGADTMGCLLATDFDTRIPLTLMIDIGTNGELVLGNKNRMITCSTAAGPAFEGAKITCGMRGAAGAIDHLTFEGGKLQYTTIGGEKPIGLCGSGLMDLIALLLEYGFMDSSGRLFAATELKQETAQNNVFRLAARDGMPCFIIDEDVYLTQKDIREVQLAKGAIAAGIQLLCRRLGIEISAIEEVLIAGAFGNYMSPKSACAIGLIPPVLKDRITPIGNAAGEGSKIALINQYEFRHTNDLYQHIEFLELATEPDFQDCFVDELEFPE